MLGLLIGYMVIWKERWLWAGKWIMGVYAGLALLAGLGGEPAYLLDAAFCTLVSTIAWDGGGDKHHGKRWYIAYAIAVALIWAFAAGAWWLVCETGGC